MLKILKKINKTHIKEYVMFNITGSSIFLICHIVYLTMLLKLKYSYIEASIVSTLMSALLNYVLNSLITFKTERYSLLSLIKIIGIQFFESIPNFLILILVVEVLKLPEYIGPLIAPMIMTPIMFCLSRSILKKQP